MGKHPDLRKIAGEVNVASFRLTTMETISKHNLKTEITEWYNIVMWQGLAETAGKLLSKGQLIYLGGKFRARFFEDKQGIKKYTTEIIVDHFTVLGNQPASLFYRKKQHPAT